MFNMWSDYLLPEIELFLIHLPGRDKRISEAPYELLSPLAEVLAGALNPHLNKPFVFFGHSMGALVSFEVARQLRRRHSPQPIHLFVSAHQPPHKPDLHPFLYQLPDNEFLKETEELYGALPDVVRQDSEVLKFYLSIMRADFTMVGTYQYIHESPLDCPISVFGGLQDKSVTQDNLKSWCEQTTSSFNLQMFAGNHFFFQGSRTILPQSIKKTLLST